MTRAPVAALRRLFALGGAPGASHVVLSRMPGSERLLEPLARARVAHETSLDALARPIDVGGVLSRVAEAASNVKHAVDGGDDAPARRPPRARPVVSPDLDVAARSLHGARRLDHKPRVTSATTPAAFSESLARTAMPAAVAAVDEDYLKAVGGVTFVRPSTRTRPAAADSVVREPKAAAVVVPPFAESRRRPASPEALAGARTRVLVTDDLSDVERLLMIAVAPMHRSAPRERATTMRESEAAPASDASRLFVRAVERARAASTTLPLARRATRGESFADARPGEKPMRNPANAERSNVEAEGAPHTASTESVGGFRGLAQRTLVAHRGAVVAPVRRIEPEARTSIDVATDTLDTRVADSLARVLEREARRHGIDLAEARS